MNEASERSNRRFDSQRGKKDCPHWEKDFPVRLGQDSYTTRREFTKFLGLISASFFVGTCWAAGRRLFQKKRSSTALTVAGSGEVPIGGYKLFRFPASEDGEPCILLRLNTDKYAAYTQHCTHLNCPVHFIASKNLLACPCHHGYFSAEDGRVLEGPPRRPLTRFDVTLRAGQVWVSSADEKGRSA